MERVNTTETVIFRAHTHVKLGLLDPKTPDNGYTPMLSFELIKNFEVTYLRGCHLSSRFGTWTTNMHFRYHELTPDESSFRGHNLRSQNLCVTFCPLKSISSNPMRMKLLNYFLREPHRHTYLRVDTCQ